MMKCELLQNAAIVSSQGRRVTRAFLLFAGMTLLLGLVACRFPGGSTAIDLKPHPAPVWELKDIDGKSVASTNYSGKVVLLTFWATWCPPCRLEVPGLISLQRKYASAGFTVLGISLDETGAKVVKPFLQEYAINYPVAIGDDKITGAFGGVEAIPKTFVIDRQGTIVAGFLGLTSEVDLEKSIAPLLNPTAAVK